MIFKRIASIGFAIAFILAIAVFTDLLSGIISKTNAKYGIIVFGWNCALNEPFIL
jgi:hypothetical protein